ncbi:hypothetical protein VTO73DRAFT_438 [Trametes versicolor]
MKQAMLAADILQNFSRAHHLRPRRPCAGLSTAEFGPVLWLKIHCCPRDFDSVATAAFLLMLSVLVWGVVHIPTALK